MLTPRFSPPSTNSRSFICNLLHNEDRNPTLCPRVNSSERQICGKPMQGALRARYLPLILLGGTENIMLLSGIPP